MHSSSMQRGIQCAKNILFFMSARLVQNRLRRFVVYSPTHLMRSGRASMTKKYRVRCKMLSSQNASHYPESQYQNTIGQSLHCLAYLQGRTYAIHWFMQYSFPVIRCFIAWSALFRHFLLDKEQVAGYAISRSNQRHNVCGCEFIV